METQILRKALEAPSIPSINRICNTTYSIYESLEDIKCRIVKQECQSRSVKLCMDIEESVLSILEEKPIYTEEQKELVKLLNEYNYVAEAMEPPLKEEEINLDDLPQEDEFMNLLDSVMAALRATPEPYNATIWLIKKLSESLDEQAKRDGLPVEEIWGKEVASIVRIAKNIQESTSIQQT